MDASSGADFRRVGDSPASASSDAAALCRARIVDSVPLRLVCYDLDRRIVWLNDYTSQLLGRSAQELIGARCCEVWQNCEQPAIDCHLSQAIRSGEQSTARVHTPDGRIWDLAAYPIRDARGELFLISEYGEDVTEKERSQQLQREIEAITRHDLKSPALASVNVARLLLRSDNLGEDQRDLLQELEHSGLRMLEIVDNALVLHKIERGEYEPVRKAVDCLAAARDVAARCRRLAEPRGVSIAVRLNGESPPGDACCRVLGEESLLKTALANLVKNAVEASPPGGVAAIDISRNGGVELAVSNSGAVPAEIRDRFFEKYVTSGKAKGTGLGAYSARMLAEAQGAAVSMQTSDEEGGWTRVTLSLEAADQSD